MNQVKHESENKMMPKGQIDSPSTDECSSGLPVAARGGVLKKGPWTSAEDTILMDYVKKHGEGNWNAVQRHSGLSRCGKSCRLRWANHLRPNLKKGAITPEEERVIIELHSRMGNKWARMAGYLPGRTDNEIKNYWNTRIKRRQRANLPLYPFDASNKNLQSQGVSQFSSIDKHHNEDLQGNTYDTLPDVIFDNYKADQGTFSCAQLFPDISASSMQTQGFGSKSFGFMNPTGNHIKRLREPETVLPGFHGSLPGGYLTFEQFPTGPPEKIHRGFGLPYPYDPDPSSKNLAPFGGAIHGSHAQSNGNLSTSRPRLGTSKLELPSLQYSETGLSSWLECPSPRPLEEGGKFIQPPLAAEPVPSDFALPRKSGLLQDLVHESHAISSTNNQTSEKSLTSSVFMPNDMVESSGPKLSEAEWGEYKDPISPLGLNAASVFSETPPISISSLDEFPHSKPLSGSELMLANAERVSTPNVEVLECPTQPDFPNPDAFLGPNWLDESSEGVKEHSTLNYNLASILDDDYCSEYKDIPSGAATSSIAQELGLESYPWNNMPSVCHMSEIP